MSDTNKKQSKNEYNKKPITDKQLKHLISLGYKKPEGMTITRLEYSIVMKEHYSKIEPTDKQVEAVEAIIKDGILIVVNWIGDFLSRNGKNHYSYGVIISKFGKATTTKERIDSILNSAK